MGKFFGKYRAYVADVNDPECRGRIKVVCPKITGEGISNWCEPCSPVAYNCGGDFYIPNRGDTVWIEFEEGNPTKPIWVGNWWVSGKTPVSNATYTSEGVNTRTIEYKGCHITMKEAELKLQLGSSMIKLTPTNIVISAPRVDIN